MTLDKHRAWWKEPMVWMIFGLPLSAVVASMVTIWFAANNADTLVFENYRKDGLAISQDSAREDIASQLGLSAHIEASAGQLLVQLAGNLDSASADTLKVTLLHPTEAKGDIQLNLQKTGEGAYQAALPDLNALQLAPDQHQVAIEPENQSWRLQGQWATPFIGSLDIQAKQRNSSTHP